MDKTKNQMILRKRNGKVYRAIKKDYFFYFKLKDKMVGQQLFTKTTPDAIHNITSEKNIFTSALGGEIVGMKFGITAPNFESFVLTPSQDSVLKEIGRVNNLARLKFLKSTTPMLDVALSRYLQPVPMAFKGEAANAGNPMNTSFAEYNPISSQAKIPVMTLGDKPLYIGSDEPIEVQFYMLGATSVGAALQDHYFMTDIFCYEYIEEVAVAVKTTA